jgi:tRNA uridine 5-carbamoylmethylation protein Kti12
LTFAGVFLSACAQALQSLKQGANPVEVLHFLDLCGPAVLAHLKRIANDPLRKPTVEQMMDQMQRMMELTDELRKMIQKKQQQQKLQQQKTQQAMSDEALAARKLQGEEMRKNIKLKAQLQRDAVKTRSQLVIADATAASNIHRQNRLAAFKE